MHIQIFRYKKFMYDLVFSRRNAHLSVGWELIPLWRFEPPALLNPFKPDRPDGRLNLNAAAPLTNWALCSSSPGCMAYCSSEFVAFFPRGGRNRSQYTLAARTSCERRSKIEKKLRLFAYGPLINPPRPLVNNL